MYSLDEVYGSDYYQKSQSSRTEHLINIIVNNISHRQFELRLDANHILWNNDQINPKYIQQICQRVNQENQNLTMYNIDLGNIKHRHLIPYFIDGVPVVYFYIVDREYNKIHVIYITTSEIGQFNIRQSTRPI